MMAVSWAVRMVDVSVVSKAEWTVGPMVDERADVMVVWWAVLQVAWMVGWMVELMAVSWDVLMVDVSDVSKAEWTVEPMVDERADVMVVWWVEGWD